MDLRSSLNKNHKNMYISIILMSPQRLVVPWRSPRDSWFFGDVSPSEIVDSPVLVLSMRGESLTNMDFGATC